MGGALAQPPGTGLLAVVNSVTGKIVAARPMRLDVDALEFDPKTGLVYVSTGGGEGALSIFHEDNPDKYTLVQNVKMSEAMTMALDNKTGTVYLPVADFGSLPEPTPEKSNPRAPAIP
jgi:hypothetical protein